MLMIKDDELMIKKMKWKIFVDVAFLDLLIWTLTMHVYLNTVVLLNAYAEWN